MDFSTLLLILGLILAVLTGYWIWRADPFKLERKTQGVFKRPWIPLLVSGASVVAVALGLFVLSRDTGQSQIDRVLVVLLSGSTKDEASLLEETLIPRFNSATGIRVIVETAPSDELQAIMDRQIELRVLLTDIIIDEVSNLAPFARAGYFLDLESLQVKIPGEMHEFLVEGARVDSRLHYLPYLTTVNVTYYRSDVFTELGIDPPTNWAELRSTCAELKEASGSGRCLFNGGLGTPTGAQIFEWVVSAGGDPLTLDDPGTEKAFEFVRELQEADLLSPQSAVAGWDSAPTIFEEGNADMMQFWSVGSSAILDAETLQIPQFGIYKGFAGLEREVHAVAASGVAIMNGTPDREEARQFIEFLLSREAQEILAAELGSSGIRDDAFGLIEEERLLLYEVANDAMQFGFLYPTDPYLDDSFELLTEGYARIVYQEENTALVLNELAGRLEEIRNVTP